MRKTVRFYESLPKDRQALDKLSEYKKYGFDNERSMIIAAILSYKTEQISVPDVNQQAETIALKVAEILQGNNVTIASLVSAIEDDTGMVRDKTKEKKNIKLALGFINGLDEVVSD